MEKAVTYFSIICANWYGCRDIAGLYSEIFPSPAFLWIGQRIDAIYILYVILGFIGIFYYYWNKPWMYLDEIIRATGEIYEQNSQPIVLSESLRPIESQMNQIKMSVLLNKQAAREAEDKQNELVMYLAHDIRTPLTTVIGYLSLLSEAPDMPPEQKKNIRKSRSIKRNALKN